MDGNSTYGLSQVLNTTRQEDSAAMALKTTAFSGLRELWHGQFL